MGGPTPVAVADALHYRARQLPISVSLSSPRSRARVMSAPRVTWSIPASAICLRRAGAAAAEAGADVDVSGAGEAVERAERVSSCRLSGAFANCIGELAAASSHEQLLGFIGTGRPFSRHLRRPPILMRREEFASVP